MSQNTGKDSFLCSKGWVMRRIPKGAELCPQELGSGAMNDAGASSQGSPNPYDGQESALIPEKYIGQAEWKII